MNFSRISNSTVLGKVLRSPLRLIPSSTVVPILQGPLRGKKWIVGSSTHGCWVGSYEYAQQTVFAQSLSPEGVVYDLGANVGFYSLLAGALVGPAGRVYAFEPLPRNVAYLRKHVALNRLENCFVFEAAVADSDGESRFHPFADASMGRLSDQGQNMVRAVRLDSLHDAGEIVPPTFIKIDIEGGELEALKGGARLIERYRPTIMLATHGADAHRTCLQFLRDRQYRLESLTAEPVVSAAELIAHP
jgi:FkbM family methyltransferase